MWRRGWADRAPAAVAAVAAMACVALLVWPSPAAASDHIAPNAALLTGPFVQAARVPDTYWVERHDGECFYPPLDAGSPQPYPRALVVPGGRRRVAIRFAKPRRPARLRVAHAERIKPNYGFAGPYREPRVALTPERSAGRVVAWRATFWIDVRDHQYISVGADWRDEGGCDRGRPPSQEAYWSFHLRARG